MVMTDVSGSTQRADALGRLGVSYGVGMVVGPTVGGYITSLGATESQGTHLAASVAAAVCAVAMVIVLAFVPHSTKDPARIARTDSKENKIFGMFVVCIVTRFVQPLSHHVSSTLYQGMCIICA